MEAFVPVVSWAMHIACKGTFWTTKTSARYCHPLSEMATGLTPCTVRSTGQRSQGLQQLVKLLSTWPYASNQFSDKGLSSTCIFSGYTLFSCQHFPTFMNPQWWSDKLSWMDLKWVNLRHWLVNVSRFFKLQAVDCYFDLNSTPDLQSFIRFCEMCYDWLASNGSNIVLFHAESPTATKRLLLLLFAYACFCDSVER